MSAREQLLDAFEEILITAGESAATLDAVAERAGVSKGGLLYHFPSKAALIDGLAVRLADRTNADLAAMKNAPEGAAAYYLRTSTETGDDYGRVLIAANRLSRGSRDRIDQIQRDGQEAVLALLEVETGSPSAALALLLIGDGLYYNALTDGACTPALIPDLTATVADIASRLGH